MKYRYRILWSAQIHGLMSLLTLQVQLHWFAKSQLSLSDSQANKNNIHMSHLGNQPVANQYTHVVNQSIFFILWTIIHLLLYVNQSTASLCEEIRCFTLWVNPLIYLVKLSTASLCELIHCFTLWNNPLLHFVNCLTLWNEPMLCFVNKSTASLCGSIYRFTFWISPLLYFWNNPQLHFSNHSIASFSEQTHCFTFLTDPLLHFLNYYTASHFEPI